MSHFRTSYRTGSMLREIFVNSLNNLYLYSDCRCYSFALALSLLLPLISQPSVFCFFSFIFNELFQVPAREEQIKGTVSTGRKGVTIEPINQSNENRSSNLNALRRTFVFFS